MFFTYDQNNPYGKFEGPAIAVIVEADSPTEADTIAMTLGVYFDEGYQLDCECCGSRWGRASEGTTEPLLDYRYSPTAFLCGPGEYTKIYAKKHSVVPVAVYFKNGEILKYY